MRVTAALFACMAGLTACTGHQVRSYDSTAVVATSPDHVMVLMSDPQRPFAKIGAVSVKQLKGGFSDPTVMDAEKQLKQAGAELGADAVVVRNSHTNDTRIIYVDAEAIRYTH